MARQSFKIGDRLFNHFFIHLPNDQLINFVFPFKACTPEQPIKTSLAFIIIKEYFDIYISNDVYDRWIYGVICKKVQQLFE